MQPRRSRFRGSAYSQNPLTTGYKPVALKTILIASEFRRHFDILKLQRVSDAENWLSRECQVGGHLGRS